MNPQYMNQQGGYHPGYGAPPSSQPYSGPPGPPAQGHSYGGPPPPNSMYNGPSQNLTGPPGPYGAPSKPGPATSLSNGPPPGPMGQQPGYRGPVPSSSQGYAPRQPGPGPPQQPGMMGQPRMAGPPLSSTSGPLPPPGSMTASPPMQPGMGQPPSSTGGHPPMSMSGPSQNTMNQMTNQMGAVNFGQPPRAGPPSSMPNQYPGAPTSRQPPGPAMPPSGGPGPVPRPGYPTSTQSGPPLMPGIPQQQGIPPQVSTGMPPMPGNMPPMPSNMPSMPGNMPPSSMSGPPSGPLGYNQGPPGPGLTMPPANSMGAPNAFPGPPSSLPNQYGAPPVGPGGSMPPPPSPGGGYPGNQPYQGGQRAGMPSAPAPLAQQPQQPRKLDPDQMPSPIQVIEDDRRNRTGEYVTGSRGSVPPLVTTNFTVQDRGGTTPRMMRSTMYNIPCTNDMMKQSNLPFITSITPYARLEEGENPLPLVDLGQLGPVRCNRCKAYMNPYMLFVDGGRRFQCCFCGCNTEVPPEYFAHLDHTGRRVDCFDRPELCLGSYEFVATEDYCKNNKLPKAPAYIFMIDVSYNAVKSGLVNLICENLKEEVLVNLPKESNADESDIRVGFVTYGKELHFYNVKGSLAQPQMLVVSDVQDVFVPLLDGFLVKLSESEAVIDSLLSQIPQTFAESRETEIVLGPVIQAGLDALKAADCPGKLFIFHTSLPVAEAPGKLKNRDDRKLLGTEKEKTILTPGNSFYTTLGQECVAAGCGVDLFLFPNSYIDISSISEVPRLTGGNIYKYSYFQADLDGSRLIEDLRINVERPIAFDCIMRIRTSTGIRPVDFLGNFYMANTTDVEIANMDCDKTVTVEIKHDDKLSEAEGATIQAAVLYTSISGQRRLRVLNMAYNCCTQMADLFRNCELDTLVNYMAKLAIRESLNSNPKTVRENLMTRCANILACYRKNCASPSSAGQLILPECMKLLPLYTNCIIKSHVLQGASEVSTDDRSYLIHTVNGMSVKDTHAFFYPRLLPLHEMDIHSEEEDLPTAVRCSYERLKDTGVYLIENGLCMLIWIGINVSSEWVSGLFGVQSAAQIDIDQTRLQDLDNPISRKVRSVVEAIRQERLRYLKLVIVRQRDKLEPVFQQYLAEDRSSGGGASYVDFLCHIHKEIRSLLS